MSDIGLTPTEFVFVMVAGGFGFLAFLALVAVIGGAIIHRDIDEHRGRRELRQAQDREERLTPIVVRPTEPARHSAMRTHRREQPLLPSRRGDL